MKLVANLLLVASLAAGALSAATSYHVPIADADALAKRKKPFILNADAGVVILKNDRVLKLAQQDQQLTVARAIRSVHPSILVPPILPVESIDGMRYGLEYRSLVRTNEKQLATAKWDRESGFVLDKKGMRLPLIRKGDVLTEPLLKELRAYNKQFDEQDASVRYLRGKEFSVSRWPGRWVFLASIVGLGFSAYLLRFASKKELVHAKATGVAEGPEEALQKSLAEVQILLGLLHENPRDHEVFENLLRDLGEEHETHVHSWADSRSGLIAQFGPGGFADLDAALGSDADANPRLDAIRERLDEAQLEQVERYAKARLALLKQIGTKPEYEWAYWIVDFEVQVLERLGELQRTHLAAFVDARPRLIARLGMGGFADVMDSFAGAERQLNRAWSAAADGVMEEAVVCLLEGASLLEATIEKLQSGEPTA